jgi:hypothetical protein
MILKESTQRSRSCDLITPFINFQTIPEQTLISLGGEKAP